MNKTTDKNANVAAVIRLTKTTAKVQRKRRPLNGINQNVPTLNVVCL